MDIEQQEQDTEAQSTFDSLWELMDAINPLAEVRFTTEYSFRDRVATGYFCKIYRSPYDRPFNGYGKTRVEAFQKALQKYLAALPRAKRVEAAQRREQGGAGDE